MKRGKISLLLMGLICLVLMFTACTSNNSGSTATEPETNGEQITEPDEESKTVEQVLRISLPGDPSDLNPLTMQDTHSFEIANAMYEGLTRIGNGGTIEKGLAEKWDVSEDGKVYTFTLRDAVWTDGTPITAYDFEYSWKKVLSPELASSYSYLLYDIVNGEDYNTGKITDPDMLGIKALDGKTFEVKLNQPIPYFPSLVSMSTCMPIKANTIEDKGEGFALSPDTMITSGPFKMVEWINDQSITLVKNENYWDKDSVKLEKIIVESVKETNTMVNMFDTGELDMMLVSSEFVDKYRDVEGFGQQADAVVGYFKYNFKNEYFANKNIRKAFSISFNRDRFVNVIINDGSMPAYAYVPPVIPGKTGGDFRSQNGDLAYDTGRDPNAAKEAKELLEKGLKEIGKTLEDFNSSGLSLVIGEGDFNLKLAQVSQQEWKEILGVEVEIKSLKYALRQAEYDTEKYFIGKEGWGADYNDPKTFLDLFTSTSPYNDLGFSNEKYDELIAKSNVTTGDERMGYLLEAEKILFDEYVINTTTFETRNFIQKPYVKGNVRNNVGVKNEYKWAYIEK